MSKIEWTEATWNPIVGCSVVSPGCTNCYAMRMAGRLAAMGQERYVDLTKRTKAGHVWTGRMRPVPSALTLPFKRRRPTTYFVNSMSDLFHESVPDVWIDRVFAVMALCPQHTFQVLTKRSARMRAYLSDPGLLMRLREAVCRQDIVLGAEWASDVHFGASDGLPLPNVWLGVSAEDQGWADERVPDLLATPAAVRFVSAEPLLGPISFRHLRRYNPKGEPWIDALRGLVTRGQYLARSPSECSFATSTQCVPPELPRLDWIIVGGESGPGARPMHPDWARQIRDACAATGVAFHYKQHGAYVTALDRDVEDPDWRADYSGKLNDRRPEIAWLNLEGGRGFHGERFHVMRRVGKAAAGRLLDGKLHDAMPEVARG